MNRLLNIKKKLMLFVLGSFTIGSIQSSTFHQLSVNIDGTEPLEVKNNEGQQPSFLKDTPALGFGNLVANYTFIQFLLYFGDRKARYRTGYGASPDFFETIIYRDPYFKDFYLFLSQSTSVHAGNPDTAIDLMNAGIENLAPNQPLDGYHIWRYKGVDELLFAGDGKSAQRSFEISADWAAQSNEPDSDRIGQRSQRTAQFLSANPDSKQAQISAWGSIFMSAVDDGTRQRAIRKIRELGGDVVFGENGSVSIKYVQVEQNRLGQESDS